MKLDETNFGKELHFGENPMGLMMDPNAHPVPKKEPGAKTLTGEMPALKKDIAARLAAKHAARKESTVQVGDNSNSLNKEYNKLGNVGPSEASRIAAELAESWWCGTPALEDRAERRNQDRKHAGKVEKSQLPLGGPGKGLRYKGKPKEIVKPAENIDNWSANVNTLEACIDEVTKASKPKPASKPASKPKSTSSKPKAAEQTGDETHKGLLMKMAKTVTNSTAKGISAKHILAAGYAMHTFDDETLATPKAKKASSKKEAIEQIVDQFLEDTMTGDIGSMALGFAPTGQMDPHEGRPGPGKKKKKKNQFGKLAQMVSSNRYHKLTQKVAGAMPT